MSIGITGERGGKEQLNTGSTDEGWEAACSRWHGSSLRHLRGTGVLSGQAERYQRVG